MYIVRCRNSCSDAKREKRARRWFWEGLQLGASKKEALYSFERLKQVMLLPQLVELVFCTLITSSAAFVRSGFAARPFLADATS